MSIFAVFFAAALAVERLIEPLTLLDTKKPKLETDTKTKKAEVVAAARPLPPPPRRSTFNLCFR